MSYPLIASKLFTEAWCIRPEVHASITTQFRARAGGAPRVDVDGMGEPMKKPECEISGPVACMDVCGIIGKHLSGLEIMCGGFDLAEFESELEEIRNTPGIQALIINFNTPGGVAIGVESAANAIRATSAAGIRVYGYTDYQCCSAGYWLASACDEFHAEASAIVGSISTFIAGIDSHRMWEMEGLELKLFRTGELKAIGMDGKPWTAEEEAFMQERVNAVDAKFKGFVLARRKMDPACLNGGFWSAADAPARIVDSTSFANIQQLAAAVYQSL